jgi:hypothetical protein
MLLIGSLPSAFNAGNGEKVLGALCDTGKETITDAAHGLEKNRLGRIVFDVPA